MHAPRPVRRADRYDALERQETHISDLLRMLPNHVDHLLALQVPHLRPSAFERENCDLVAIWRKLSNLDSVIDRNGLAQCARRIQNFDLISRSRGKDSSRRRRRHVQGVQSVTSCHIQCAIESLFELDDVLSLRVASRRLQLLSLLDELIGKRIHAIYQGWAQLGGRCSLLALFCLGGANMRSYLVGLLLESFFHLLESLLILT
mmetsp:Transcript_11799/g.14976  ORF Transcript_11799/g.14976 Transcript_11799/m.14976 type:complete len:204 (+) Transcript_11799:647-1258(+)